MADTETTPWPYKLRVRDRAQLARAPYETGLVIAQQQSRATIAAA